MNEFKKKFTFFRKRILPVLLVVALIITGSLAYFTSGRYKRTKYVHGNVKTELWELFDTDFDGVVAGYTDGSYNLDDLNDEVYGPDESNPTTSGYLLPNQTVTKAPWVKNTGNNEAYVYAEVGLPTQHTPIYDPLTGEKVSDGEDGVVFHFINEDGDIDVPNDGWTNLGITEHRDGFDYYLFSYDYKLAPGTETPHIFEQIQYANVDTLLPYEDFNAGTALPSELVVTNGQASKGFRTFFGEVYTITEQGLDTISEEDLAEKIQSLYERLYNAEELKTVENSGITHQNGDSYFFKVATTPLTYDEIASARMKFLQQSMVNGQNVWETVEAGLSDGRFDATEFLSYFNEDGSFNEEARAEVENKTSFSSWTEAAVAIILMQQEENPGARQTIELILRNDTEANDNTWERYTVTNADGTQNEFLKHSATIDGSHYTMYMVVPEGSDIYNTLPISDEYKHQAQENNTDSIYYEKDNVQVYYPDGGAFTIVKDSGPNNEDFYLFAYTSMVETMLSAFNTIPQISEKYDILSFNPSVLDMAWFENAQHGSEDDVYSMLYQYMSSTSDNYNIINLKESMSISDFDSTEVFLNQKINSMFQGCSDRDNSTGDKHRDITLDPGVYFLFSTTQPLNSLMGVAMMMMVQYMGSDSPQASITREQLQSLINSIVIKYPYEFKTADGSIVSMGYNMPINEYAVQCEGFEDYNVVDLFNECFPKTRTVTREDDLASADSDVQEINDDIKDEFKPHNKVFFDYSFKKSDFVDDIPLDRTNIDKFYLEEWLSLAKSCGYAKMSSTPLTKENFLEGMYISVGNIPVRSVFAKNNVSGFVSNSYPTNRVVITDDYMTFAPVYETVHNWNPSDNGLPSDEIFSAPMFINVKNTSTINGITFEPGVYCFYYYDLNDVMHALEYTLVNQEAVPRNTDDYTLLFDPANLENYELIETGKYKISDVGDISSAEDFVSRLGIVNRRWITREKWKNISTPQTYTTNTSDGVLIGISDGSRVYNNNDTTLYSTFSFLFNNNEGSVLYVNDSPCATYLYKNLEIISDSGIMVIDKESNMITEINPFSVESTDISAEIAAFGLSSVDEYLDMFSTSLINYYTLSFDDCYILFESASVYNSESTLTKDNDTGNYIIKAYNTKTGEITSTTVIASSDSRYSQVDTYYADVLENGQQMTYLDDNENVVVPIRYIDGGSTISNVDGNYVFEYFEDKDKYPYGMILPEEESFVLEYLLSRANVTEGSSEKPAFYESGGNQLVYTGNESAGTIVLANATLTKVNNNKYHLTIPGIYDSDIGSTSNTTINSYTNHNYFDADYRGWQSESGDFTFSWKTNNSDEILVAVSPSEKFYYFDSSTGTVFRNASPGIYVSDKVTSFRDDAGHNVQVTPQLLSTTEQVQTENQTLYKIASWTDSTMYPDYFRFYNENYSFDVSFSSSVPFESAELINMLYGINNVSTLPIAYTDSAERSMVTFHPSSYSLLSELGFAASIMSEVEVGIKEVANAAGGILGYSVFILEYNQSMLYPDTITNGDGSFVTESGETGFIVPGIDTPVLTVIENDGSLPDGLYALSTCNEVGLLSYNNKSLNTILTEYNTLYNTSVSDLPSSSGYVWVDSVPADLSTYTFSVSYDVPLDIPRKSSSLTATINENTKIWSDNGTPVFAVVNNQGVYFNPDYTFVDALNSDPNNPNNVTNIESSHPYSDGIDTNYQYTAPEGTASIKFTFSGDTKTESRFDWIYITDSNGNQVGDSQRYSGADLAGQTFTVSGDSFTVRLTSDSSGNDYGFAISSIMCYDSSDNVILNLGNALDLTSAVNATSSPAIELTEEILINDVDFNNVSFTYLKNTSMLNIFADAYNNTPKSSDGYASSPLFMDIASGHQSYGARNDSFAKLFEIMMGNEQVSVISIDEDFLGYLEDFFASARGATFTGTADYKTAFVPGENSVRIDYQTVLTKHSDGSFTVQTYDLSTGTLTSTQDVAFGSGNYDSLNEKWTYYTSHDLIPVFGTTDKTIYIDDYVLSAYIHDGENYLSSQYDIPVTIEQDGTIIITEGEESMAVEPGNDEYDMYYDSINQYIDMGAATVTTDPATGDRYVLLNEGKISFYMSYMTSREERTESESEIVANDTGIYLITNSDYGQINDDKDALIYLRNKTAGGN